MKHLCIILIFLLSFQTAAQTCNPRTDIYEDSKTGKFIYTESCHLEFGKLKMIEKEREKQIEHLEQSIKLKDLALDISDKRIENWQQTTYKLEDRLLKMEKNTDRMNWIYFGLGIVVMGGATWAAGQLK